jgi:hypothetical protein
MLKLIHFLGRSKNLISQPKQPRNTCRFPQSNSTPTGGKHAHLAADFGLGALCTGAPVEVKVAAAGHDDSGHDDVGDARLVAEVVQ